jgi:ribosome maturation factor RimP
MTRTEILELVEPLIQEPFFLVAIELTPGGKGPLVRVRLDTDAGITIDECAQWSRKLGDIIDVKELFRGRYTLEVTSPGLNRPLVSIRQYRKNIGRMLKMLIMEDDKEVSLNGRLLEVEEEKILLKINDEERTFKLAEIVEAKVQVEI